MRKVALADVLWEAANKYLSVNGRQVWPLNATYTCDALSRPLGGYGHLDLPPRVAKWLKALGCDPKHDGYRFEAPAGRVRQGVRYMWLLIAMHCAEDEGIYITVED